MALTIRALVVLLIGLVVGSLMRPVEAQPPGSPFIVGQNLVLSLVNEGTITLDRTSNDVPDALGAGDIELVPFLAGREIGWSFAG